MSSLVSELAGHSLSSGRSRRLLFFFAMGALFYSVLAATIAQVNISSSPRALPGWPQSAQTLASIGSGLLGLTGAPRETPKAIGFSVAALRRSPIEVVAARTLALAEDAQSNSAASHHALDFAHYLSRRDLPTELALIERSVAEQDIAKALDHYDHALRTNANAEELLFPVLVTAAADPKISTLLVKKLAMRPLWWRAYVGQLLAANPAPEVLLAVLGPLHLNWRDNMEQPLLAGAVSQMVVHGQYSSANVLIRTSRGAGRVSGGLRNGDFESDPVVPGFDWTLSDTGGNATARIELNGGTKTRTLFLASGGTPDDLAQQLVLLSAGRHNISGIAGDISTNEWEQPHIVIDCSEQPSTVLLDQPIPTRDATGGSFSFEFLVPSRCAVQSIRIRASRQITEGGAASWIDDLRFDSINLHSK